jgi:hypothetical protein
VASVNDYPEPETYPRPDYVVQVEKGALPIPKRVGIHAATNLRDGCRLCALRLQHEHDGIAAWPF